MFGWDDALMIGSSLFGFGASRDSADATSKASDQNYQINKENLDFQKQARTESIAEARRLEAEGKQGVTDAYGNRVRYVQAEAGSRNYHRYSRPSLI